MYVRVCVCAQTGQTGQKKSSPVRAKQTPRTLGSSAIPAPLIKLSQPTVPPYNLLLLLLLLVVEATDYIVDYCYKSHLQQDPNCPRKLGRVIERTNIRIDRKRNCFSVVAQWLSEKSAIEYDVSIGDVGKVCRNRSRLA